jgi:hypothetical protein
MTYEEIKQMLLELGLPVSYWNFDDEEMPAAPYIIFTMPESDNVAADGKVYQKVNKLYIELYVNSKSPRIEAQLEELMDAHGLFYNRQEYYIEKDKMFEELYTLEV